MKILSVGATGSIGRHVVAEASRRGHTVRALTRDQSRGRGFGSFAEVVVGDLTRPETLTAAVAGVEAVVFTHGAAYGSDGLEAIDYGGVRNVLAAIGDRPVRIALMTAIGVTGRGALHDWKRRSERLVRASGHDYTIVRPGWFDYNDADQEHLHFLQGDTRHAGSPADGVAARSQIAQVLVASVTSAAAARKTFELVAERGPAQTDLEPLFTALSADAVGSLDGVRDAANLPLGDEPARVRVDLDAVRSRS